MTTPIVLRNEAQQEFDEAFDWYNAQRPGLGELFVTEVQRVFDRIVVTPEIYPTVLADIHKAVVKRFPYCVFYRSHSDRVEVLAVFHSRRNPSVWQGRV